MWGVFGLLALYSAGNLIITVGTVSGLLALLLAAAPTVLGRLGLPPT